MENMQLKPAVYVVDPYHDAAISKLQESNKIDLILPTDSRRDDYLSKATAILIRSETQLRAADIDKANSDLKYIIKQGVGVDNIDLEAARRRGIKVFNTAGLNGETVAELTIGLALSVARRICEFDRAIRGGEKVIRSKCLGKSLFNKTIGIVGMGNIGLKVAKKWRGAMGGKIIAFDPYAKEGAWTEEIDSGSLTRVSDLEDLLRVSDVVTLHDPITSSTRNPLSCREFSLLKEGAILLNCARGEVVDENALLTALQSGRLFGAGLDALVEEPPTLARYGATLLSHPRIILAPHVGASTEENQVNSGLAADILINLLEENWSRVPKPMN